MDLYGLCLGMVIFVPGQEEVQGFHSALLGASF